MAKQKVFTDESLVTLIDETKSYVDNAVSGKANSSHTHSISNVTNLQTTLDTKAAQSSLDSHTSNSDIHVTTTNKSNWNSAYSHSTSAHAPSNAEKNVIVGIQKNGTDLTVNSSTRKVNITVPTTAADIGAAASGHNHDDKYDAKGAANTALASAKTYADTAASNAATSVKNELLNGAGTAYDTLKELGDLIDNNQDAIEALETVAAGKADKTHSHAISDVSGLQSALDGKAASSHGTHVSYSSTAPVMDGTASVGSASTVARSDHKHPTDTSRASKTEFDNHVADSTAHMTSTQKSNLTTAYNHSQAAHAPSDAQKNQNAFSNIAVSGQTTVAADTTTDTVTFVGSNVSITTDATNDKVTFTVADGSTSAKGVVQLTNSTSSTSTTTAATPSSVKSAYDLANTAKTNAATAQSKADSAYTLAEGKVDSLSDLGITATATELNYVDGVTKNVQTQLNGKADSNHEHEASEITSGTLSSAVLPTVPVSKGGTGATSFTAGRALISNGTDAFETRSITDYTDTTGILTANNNLITQNTLRNTLNRASSVASSNSSYDTYMVRGVSLNNTETTPSQNGQIAWTYE